VRLGSSPDLLAGLQAVTDPHRTPAGGPHFLLSAEAMFSAAHTLPGVPMCERMHGHNWRVRVTVRVAQTHLDAVGMAVDFRAIERTARDAVADFEHAHLNELEPFQERPPTAERVAQVVCGRVTRRLVDIAPAATVEEVEVWELPQYRVSYRPGPV
jgi:6-pyruvoyltetrahydropterin/6-carboxytetrahydropterin synthase